MSTDRRNHAFVIERIGPIIEGRTSIEHDGLITDAEITIRPQDQCGKRSFSWYCQNGTGLYHLDADGLAHKGPSSP